MKDRFITLQTIFRHPALSQFRILAGQRGMNGTVERVSVFDCGVDDILFTNENILRPGDLFITCLEQFRSGEESQAEDYFRILIRTRSAGVIIVGDRGLYNFTPDIQKICDEAPLPVIFLPINIPYALIIDTVNQYISMDTANAMNLLRIQKIMYGDQNDSDSLELLNSMKSDIGPVLRTVFCYGEFRSDLDLADLHVRYLQDSACIFAVDGKTVLFILTAEDENQLRHRTDALTSRISSEINEPRIGFSRIHPRREIRQALEEGRRALDTARSMESSALTYDPLNVTQLLLILRDTPAASDFYHAYRERIQRAFAAEKIRDILETMEVYVAKSGNFSETARALNQHENTIRYRVNRVKAALDMENDNIKFHETLALAVKLRTILGEPLE